MHVLGIFSLVLVTWCSHQLQNCRNEILLCVSSGFLLACEMEAKKH